MTKATLKTISAANVSKVVDGLVAVAVEDAKAGVSRLSQVAAIVRSLGRPITGAEWDSLVKPGLVAGLEKSKIKNPGVMASKFKTAGLGLASGLPQFKANGRTLRDYLAECAAPIREAVLKDGRAIVDTAKNGGRKPTTAKAKAAAKAAKATAKATETLSASKSDDAGHDVSRYHALAVSLMGSEAAGTMLLAILKDHRAAFDLWAKDQLAKAVDTSKPAKAAKPAPEPSKDDKAIAAQLLAMANASKARADKVNGKAN
jgi:hypothetical protein